MESISRLVLCLKRNSKTNILVVFDNIKGQNPLPVKIIILRRFMSNYYGVSANNVNYTLTTSSF